MSTNGDRLTPPHGMPARKLLEAVAGKTTQHDSDITELRSGVERLETMMGGVMSELGEQSGKIDKLGEDVRHAMKLATIPPPPPPLPTMRPEAASGIDLRAFADMVKRAAIDGEKRDGTTADEQVEKVLDVVADRRLARHARKVIWAVVIGTGGFVGHAILEYLMRHL